MRNGPRASSRAFRLFGTRLSHVPAHELADDLATRASAALVDEARRLFEAFPLAFRHPDLGREVLCVVSTHAERLVLCGHDLQGSGLLVRGHKKLCAPACFVATRALALWPQGRFGNEAAPPGALTPNGA